MSAPANSSGGAHEGWMQSSTCRAAEDAGRAAGREYGLAESISRTLAGLLGRQARRKLGGADATGRAALDGLARAFAADRLGELADRLVTSSSWADWLADLVVPPPAEGLPAYTKGLDLDFEPSGPSIDTYFSVGLKGGGTSIVHIRIQKWYQPDLDRLLYEDSRRVERKHGKLPTVGVFLMWPPAEGPGMTGRFEDCDATGKVTHRFEYMIRRAWEMTAEEVTQSPGTMLLAPLTRGARERMPEIVRMIGDSLDRNRADARTRELVWATVYWNMGLLCELDEAHRALGDVLPLIHRAKPYLDAKGHAFLEAYSAAHEDGRRQAGRDLVLRQATLRFGPNADAEAAIRSIDEPADLDAMAQRALTAAGWPSLLAGP
jgi:hypothetical protein